MKYLLDTCILSYFARGHENVCRRLTSTPRPLVAISSVTEMEVEFGLALHPERTHRAGPVMRRLIESVHVLVLEREDARAAAAIRATLRRLGKPIGAYDVLLAGTALRRGLIVATGNVGEFNRVSGLLVEDWTKAD